MGMGMGLGIGNGNGMVCFGLVWFEGSANRRKQQLPLPLP